MSILARSKPYRTRIPATYICERCGIQKPSRQTRKPTHCPDCRPYMKDTQ